MKIFSWFGNRSIFLKILLVIVLAAFLVNVFVTMILHAISAPPKGRFIQFLKGCANYVVDDLGSPPNLDKAKKYSESLGIQISFQGNDENWSTADQVLEYSQITYSRYHNREDFRFGKMGDRPLIRLQHQTGAYYLFPEFNIRSREVTSWIMTMVAFLSLVFLGVYLWIRKLFQQVGKLRQGVEEVAKGNFDALIPVKNQDELGQLSTAFNQMTKKIQGAMHSQQQLLWNVSHELRSPLTRMRVALEFVEDQTIQQKLTSDISSMNLMIEGILESARLQNSQEALQLQEVDLIHFIQDILLEFDLPEGQILFLSEPEELQAEVEEKSFYSLIRNLVENAIKYSEGVSTPIEVKVQTLDKGYQIQVVDYGVGIPEKDLPYIFDPFYRVDKSRNAKTGGYGLGLSLCKEIMQAHHGSLEVESREGKTVFTAIFSS